jgi:hypothetical protein
MRFIKSTPYLLYSIGFLDNYRDQMKLLSSIAIVLKIQNKVQDISHKLRKFFPASISFGGVCI